MIIFNILSLSFVFLVDALAPGIIGHMSDISISSTSAVLGTCVWQGIAPNCSSYCPTDYIEVRRSSTAFLVNGTTGYNDPTFGDNCITGTKSLCCRPETNNCHWHGMWVNSFNQKFTCSYFGVGQCGILLCNSHATDNMKTGKSTLLGGLCNEMEMFGLFGRATCGSIFWSQNRTSDVVERWYKVL